MRDTAQTRRSMPIKKYPTFLKAASSHLVTIGWLLPPGTAAGVAKAWRAIPSIPQQTVPKRAKTAGTAKPIYRRAARPLSRENQSTSIRSFRTPFALGPSNPHPVNRAELSARCPQASCPGLSKLSLRSSPFKPFLSAKRFSPRSCRSPPAPLPQLLALCVPCG